MPVNGQARGKSRFLSRFQILSALTTESQHIRLKQVWAAEVAVTVLVVVGWICTDEETRVLLCKWGLALIRLFLKNYLNEIGVGVKESTRENEDI